jgi:hypothetical protein
MMTRRQLYDLLAIRFEKDVGAHDQRTGSMLDKGCERRIDITRVARF